MTEACDTPDEVAAAIDLHQCHGGEQQQADHTELGSRHSQSWKTRPPEIAGVSATRTAAATAASCLYQEQHWNANVCDAALQ
jgi:hypothetical protein